MEQLLSTILEHTSITGLLVPHFCPNDNPAEFTNLYHRVLSSEDKDLCFALLTKVHFNYCFCTTYSPQKCALILKLVCVGKKVVSQNLFSISTTFGKKVYELCQEDLCGELI